jgi:hypothetical protein
MHEVDGKHVIKHVAWGVYVRVCVYVCACVKCQVHDKFIRIVLQSVIKGCMNTMSYALD